MTGLAGSHGFRSNNLKNDFQAKEVFVDDESKPKR
jgi:hypothetical protein